MSRHYYRLLFVRNGRVWLHAIFENKTKARAAYLKLRMDRRGDSKRLDEVFYDVCTGKWCPFTTLNHKDFEDNRDA